MQFLKIIALSILAGVLYGIVHDQVTARICLEYFTVFHPPLLPTHSPTLLALGWGIIATWWMGAFLGTALAIVCRAGSWPKLSARNLVKPMEALLVTMAICAILAGMCGYLWGSFPEDMRGILAPSLERRFLADWWAHTASYASGFLGSVVLCAIAVWERRKRQRVLWRRADGQELNA
jgi:hypothetical protein